MAGKKQVLPVYDFDKPIRITRFRSGGLDILFYSVLLGLITIAMMFILFWREGHFVLEFTLGRTLISFPLAMVAIVLVQMLREIRTYTKALLKKSTWSIEELMKESFDIESLKEVVPSIGIDVTIMKENGDVILQSQIR